MHIEEGGVCQDLYNPYRAKAEFNNCIIHSKHFHAHNILDYVSVLRQFKDINKSFFLAKVFEVDVHNLRAIFLHISGICFVNNSAISLSCGDEIFRYFLMAKELSCCDAVLRDVNDTIA